MANQNQHSGISPALTGILLFATVMLVAALALGAGLAGLVPLPGFKHPAREARRLEELHGAEIRAIQEALKEKRLLFEETLREARASIPPDSPIAGEWHAESSIAELTTDGDDQVLLGMLSDAYLWDPCDMLGHPDSNLASKLESLRSLDGRVTHFENRFVDADENLQLMNCFEEYLLANTALEDLELALENGILDIQPNMNDLTMGISIPEFDPCFFAMRVLAARIATHAERGHADRAFSLLKQMLTLQRRTRDLGDSRWLLLNTRAWNDVLGLLANRMEWTDDRIESVGSLLACSPEDAVLRMKACAVADFVHDPLVSGTLGLEMLQHFDIVTSLAETYLNAPAELPGQLSEMGAEVEKRMLKFPHMIMFSMGIPHPVDAMLSGIGTVSYYANLPLRSLLS